MNEGNHSSQEGEPRLRRRGEEGPTSAHRLCPALRWPLGRTCAGRAPPAPRGSRNGTETLPAARQGRQSLPFESSQADLPSRNVLKHKCFIKKHKNPDCLQCITTRIQCKVTNMSQAQEKGGSTEITTKSPKNVRPPLTTMLRDVKANMLKKNEKMGSATEKFKL